MTETVSPFVLVNKPWIIRKVIADYLRAMNMFGNMDREMTSERIVPFEKLKKLSELLFTIKEDLHLIFKQLINPKSGTFEDADKFTPDKDEIEFVNNVGLLFHKVMVARELKYVMEHYSTDSDDYAMTKSSLDTYWLKLRSLFQEGAGLIKRLLRDYINNVVVLLYLLENDRYVSETIGESALKLLQRFVGEAKVSAAYLKVGQYCLDSGWKDRARRMFAEALKFNPHNKAAQQSLRQLNQNHEPSHQAAG